MRAQATFLANVQIGLHEQTRLQPEIREAMDAALLDVAEVRREILDRLETVVAAPVHAGVLKDLVNGLADDLAQEVRSVVRVVTTELMMTIGLPRGRTLRLGSDVNQRFPPTLKSLSNVELASLVATFDPTPDSPTDRGPSTGRCWNSGCGSSPTSSAPRTTTKACTRPRFRGSALDAIASGRTPDLTGIA